MELSVVSSTKEELELKIDNVTVAEVIRVYLNNDGIKFAAWRKEHPTKPVILRIESSGKTVKKAISEAVEAIKKDIESIAKLFKK